MKFLSSFIFITLSFFTFAQPPNNDCVNAIDMSNGECVTINNTGATFDSYIGGCQEDANNIWFSFTSQGYFPEINVSGPNMSRPEISVSTLTGGGTNPCDVDDVGVVFCQSTGGTASNVTASFNSIPGTTYYFQVTTSNGNGDITVCLTDEAAEPGDVCQEAEPFCSPEQFEASTNTTAPTGPDYGCLGSQPNPKWFYLEIDEGGDIDITLTPDPLVDIDYAVWGPYDSSEEGCEGIMSGDDAPVDCSFSAQEIEFVELTNTQPGETYILLITNFSGDPTTVDATQTNEGETGAGSTDCSILVPCQLQVDAGNDATICPDGSVTLNGSYSEEVGPVDIEWTSNPAEASADLSSTTVLDPTFTPTDDYGDSIVFTLSVTDNGADEVCTSTDQVTIYITPTVEDITCPDDLNADCELSEHPPYASFQAFLDAGGSVTIADMNLINETTFTSTDSDPVGTCPEVVTRTYSITDSCGVTVSCTQDIIIGANATISAPENETATVACPSNATDPGAPADITDQCGRTVSAEFIDSTSTPDPLTCAGDVVWTYRYTACDSTTADWTYTYTISAPEVTIPPAGDSSVACLDDVVAPTAPVIEDNCERELDMTGVVEGDDPGDCGGTKTFTFNYSDCSGGTYEWLFTYTITSEAPTFTLEGTDPTECGGTDGFITISGLDPNTDYTLEYDDEELVVITTDVAGEYDITGLSSDTYTGFTIADVNCTSCSTTDDSSISLGDPGASSVNAGENQVVCEGTSVTLTAQDVSATADISWDNDVIDGEPFIQAPGSVTYTVTSDESGCTSTDQVTVTVVPTIDSLHCPESLTAVCSITEQEAYGDFDEFIAAGGLVYIDPAGVIDTASFNLVSEVSDGGSPTSCAETFTRTYELSDTCGVTVTCTQEIVVEDLIDPTGTAPADSTVQCIGDIPDANTSLITDVADNCTENPSVTHVGDVVSGEPCSEVLTRTYRIEDNCGNFIDLERLFFIQDITNPTASTPDPIFVNCDTDVPDPDVNVVTDAADNCTVSPTITYVEDVSDGNVCDGEVITRTYRVEDECENFVLVEQIITIESSTPTFTISGTDPTECGETDGFITISGLDPNTDFTFEFDGNDPVTITSNGAGEFVITGLGAGNYTGVTIGDVNCPSCSTSDDGTVTLEDPNAPSVNAGVDQEICEGESVTLTADNPDGANITWDNGVEDGEPFTPASGTITYTVTAELNGCTSTDQVTINVVSQPIAEFSADPISGGAPLEVDFFDNSINGTDITWNFGNGEVGSDPEATIIYSDPGTYEVILIVTNGICSDQASIEINAFELPLTYTIPNVITPNGDGTNDILHMNLNNAESVEIEIFNRWGNLVGTVTSLDPSQGWDGTNKDSGNPVSDGVYFYTYKITSIYGEVVEGHQYVHVNSGNKE